MSFFVCYLGIGALTSFLIYKAGYFETSVQEAKERGIDKMLESSSEIFKVSLEDVVLFSLCFSGIFLWPLLWVLTLVEKLNKR
jgi:hypothetical protein